MHKIIFKLPEDEIRNFYYTIWPTSCHYPSWFRTATIKQFTDELIRIHLQLSSKNDFYANK